MIRDREKRDSRGAEMPAAAHRLMWRVTLRALGDEFGRERATRFSRTAGVLFGNEFARGFLDLEADFRTFVPSLQKALADLKVDTLRIESFNPDTGNLVITGEESLDGDGLPAAHETIRAYDRGFVDGVLEAYTGRRHEGWDV